MLPSVRFRNVEVEVKAMGEGSDHNSWQWKQILDILTHSWDNFLVLIPMKPLPTPGNQNEKDHNLPTTFLLLLLIIESLSHYREEPKLIEAKHAVQADSVQQVLIAQGIWTLTRRLHPLREGWHVRANGQK